MNQPASGIYIAGSEVSIACVAGVDGVGRGEGKKNEKIQGKIIHLLRPGVKKRWQAKKPTVSAEGTYFS